MKPLFSPANLHALLLKLSLGFALTSQQTALAAERWEPLFDAKGSKWTPWIGIPPASSKRDWKDKGGPSPHTEPDGLRKGKPVGNQDPYEIFTFSKLDSATTQLRISGEVHSSLTTKKTYRNYHLKASVKWGEKKWTPRWSAPKRSEIIYHSYDALGSVQGARSSGVGFTLEDDRLGGFIRYGDFKFSSCPGERKINDHPLFDENGDFIAITDRPWSIEANPTPSSQTGWHEIELISFENHVLHLCDGKITGALYDIRMKQGQQPLDRGAIQIVSFFAEYFLKDMRLKQLDEMPPIMRRYLKEKNAELSVSAKRASTTGDRPTLKNGIYLKTRLSKSKLSVPLASDAEQIKQISLSDEPLYNCRSISIVYPDRKVADCLNIYLQSVARRGLIEHAENQGLTLQDLDLVFVMDRKGYPISFMSGSKRSKLMIKNLTGPNEISSLTKRIKEEQ